MLKQKFEEFIHTNRMLAPGQSVVVCVSGGIDSMVLLDLFLHLSKEWSLKLTIAHVNHQLRGQESNEDEEFVRQAAAASGVAFSCQRVSTLEYAHERKLSKQEAARELRYEFFEKVRREKNADLVATAHQANDNAETVLMNVLRGTGVRGLAGIPAQREKGRIIRPLLFVYRNEIEEYAQTHRITYRSDSSNNSLRYKRNLVRQVILPGLQKEFESNILESLNRVSTVMRGLEHSLDPEVTRKRTSMVVTSKGRTTLDLSLFLSEPEFLQEEILLASLRQLGVEPSAEKVLSILKLSSQPTGRSLHLRKDLTVFRDRNYLVFGTPPNEASLLQSVSIGGTYDFGDFTFSIGIPEPLPDSFVGKKGSELVDADRLTDGLVLRSWRPGDWFVPLGMSAKKKLSDFFVDEKVPLFEKSCVPVLESSSGIVWVCGRRLDDRFKITEKTRSVVKLFYHQYV